VRRIVKARFVVVAVFVCTVRMPMFMSLSMRVIVLMGMTVGVAMFEFMRMIVFMLVRMIMAMIMIVVGFISVFMFFAHIFVISLHQCFIVPRALTRRARHFHRTTKANL